MSKRPCPTQSPSFKCRSATNTTSDSDDACDDTIISDGTATSDDTLTSDNIIISDDTDASTVSPVEISTLNRQRHDYVAVLDALRRDPASRFCQPAADIINYIIKPMVAEPPRVGLLRFESGVRRKVDVHSVLIDIFPVPELELLSYCSYRAPELSHTVRYFVVATSVHNLQRELYVYWADVPDSLTCPGTTQLVLLPRADSSGPCGVKSFNIGLARGMTMHNVAVAAINAAALRVQFCQPDVSARTYRIREWSCSLDGDIDPTSDRTVPMPFSVETPYKSRFAASSLPLSLHRGPQQQLCLLYWDGRRVDMAVTDARGAMRDDKLPGDQTLPPFWKSDISLSCMAIDWLGKVYLVSDVSVYASQKDYPHSPHHIYQHLSLFDGTTGALVRHCYLLATPNEKANEVHLDSKVRLCLVYRSGLVSVYNSQGLKRGSLAIESGEASQRIDTVGRLVSCMAHLLFPHHCIELGIGELGRE